MRSKPTKLKSTVENKTNADFNAKDFFGKQPAHLVPVLYIDSNSDSHSEAGSNDDKTLNLQTQTPVSEFSKTLPLPATGTFDKTVATPQANPRAATSPSAAKEKAPEVKAKSTAKWIDPAKAQAALQKPKPVVKEKSSFGPALLIACSIGLLAYAGLSGSLDGGAGKGASGKLTAEQLQERIEFHRKTTGWKLNNERIETQIENHYGAPEVARDAAKVKPADMMNGLPLQGETNIRDGANDRTVANTNYLDQRIMYGLQEEQDRIETEKRAEKMYVKEFIENARAGGYDVKIDKYGNVKAKKILPDDQ